MSYANVKLAFEKHIDGLQLGLTVYDSSRHRRTHKTSFILTEFYPGNTKQIFVGAAEPQERTGTFEFQVREASREIELQKLDEIREGFPVGAILTEPDLRVTIGIAELVRQKSPPSNFHYRLKINWRTYF
ncbi:hypothetical protein GUA87_09410 [Sneathiella sp. P13V-1]|uniref:hypothetical protein n=1 Tax=Sneathiella sp. P13V-1 TaxID=2697366 RepID=UPI00187B21F4|nr:hypothetical protein [Sneathiella sp. P13V-1]MBE7637060.1 hypothetical protein [Sneathiella sp. P13V-1]